jgi:drug/metabolite transporter (DMT)-like permease
MALMGVTTKVAIDAGSIMLVSFITYFTGTLMLLPYVIRKGFRFLKSERYTLLISRAFFGTAASLCYTIAIHYIPVVNGTLLFNTAPIFIPLISMIFLKATIDKSTWLAVFMGFVGIVVIIKPTTAIFTQTGNILGLISGIFLAIAYLSIKLMTTTEPGMRITFYYFAIGLLLQLPFPFLADELPNQECCLFAALAGMCLFIAQILLVKAYTFAKASEVGIYQYSSVIFVGLINWWLWNAVPALSEILGMLLVAIAGIIIISCGTKQQTLAIK